MDDIIAREEENKKSGICLLFKKTFAASWNSTTWCPSNRIMRETINRNLVWNFAPQTQVDRVHFVTFSCVLFHCPSLWPPSCLEQKSETSIISSHGRRGKQPEQLPTLVTMRYRWNWPQATAVCNQPSSGQCAWWTQPDQYKNARKWRSFHCHWQCWSLPGY